ncbi:MAG: phenylalanyl-tRNA synthetase subunit beta [Candidatus Bathyarchaeota archaeon B26-2]|nr:MAG: phenylalanyl-tRNA synthetase subunit beta [Candidatus Bathyarchaeota archaeon B26-2]
MPTIEVDYRDFLSLLGVDLPKDAEALDDVLSYVKGEVKLFRDDELHIELQDTNRPDLWCVEGLARALKGFLGLEKGLKSYVVVGDSGVEVTVDVRLREIRPYIACAVVRGIKVTDIMIREVMRLQDKMDQTYGRQRRRTSIGLYDFDLVTPPLRYGVAKPREVKFVPLEFEEELTLEEILEKHPKGVEYGHLVQPHPVWPIFIDSSDRVLSFPPIINSNDLGRITERTKNILIEVTGTSFETVLNTLMNVTLALADRGGSIHSAKIHYRYGEMGDVVTPRLETRSLTLDVNYVRRVLGLDLRLLEVKEMLERARYGVLGVDGSKVEVEVPCYRIDVMHPIDVVEDIAIAYDYNRIEPRWPKLPTVGSKAPQCILRDAVREVMVGLGFQEVLSFTLSNPENLYTKMNLNPEPENLVEIENPRIQYLTCLRNWLLPSLMEFLSRNVHVEYPQRVFEVGYCVVRDERAENMTRDVEKLACVTIHSNANFTEAKAVLDALLTNLSVRYKVEETEHNSFISGRTGRITTEGTDIGVIGEVHPQVLENWRLGNPAAAFEIDLEKVRRLL